MKKNYLNYTQMQSKHCDFIIEKENGGPLFNDLCINILSLVLILKNLINFPC